MLLATFSVGSLDALGEARAVGLSAGVAVSTVAGLSVACGDAPGVGVATIDGVSEGCAGGVDEASGGAVG